MALTAKFEGVTLSACQKLTAIGRSFEGKTVPLPIALDAQTLSA
jgi:hypothetical protein